MDTTVQFSRQDCCCMCTDWDAGDLAIGLHLMNLLRTNIIFTFNEGSCRERAGRFNSSPRPPRVPWCCCIITSAQPGSHSQRSEDLRREPNKLLFNLLCRVLGLWTLSLSRTGSWIQQLLFKSWSLNEMILKFLSCLMWGMRLEFSLKVTDASLVLLF